MTYNINLQGQAMEIGQKVTSGCLLEVCSYPSPGLVGPLSNGSHNDMNIFSFMMSTSMIAPYFSVFAQMGIDWDGQSDLMQDLRTVGKKAEKELLESTNGVNTQRGALFIGGLIAAAAGVASQQNGDHLDFEHVCRQVAHISTGVSQELESDQSMTNGERIYREIKVTGIRGEVEQGLPSIKNVGYPKFAEALNQGMGLNLSMVHSLIHLMTVVDDTTIIHRAGENGLYSVRQWCKRVLKQGSVFTESGLEDIQNLDKLFIDKNISPGGCADLMAASVSLYLLEHKNFSLHDILTTQQKDQIGKSKHLSTSKSVFG